MAHPEMDVHEPTADEIPPPTVNMAIIFSKGFKHYSTANISAAWQAVTLQLGEFQTAMNGLFTIEKADVRSKWYRRYRYYRRYQTIGRLRHTGRIS